MKLAFSKFNSLQDLDRFDFFYLFIYFFQAEEFDHNNFIQVFGSVRNSRQEIKIVLITPLGTVKRDIDLCKV